ncbi:MAG: 5-formyltetrahydrofolate cyclo-ligase [Acidobacteriota bacterium]
MRSHRHDRDAGGSPAVLERKAALRQRIWRRLDVAGIRRFPNPENRIPNFVGAEQAAERLRDTAPWQRAATLKANPDSPQWPVRQRALEDGKVLFMAVPRLAEENPFFLLDPEDLADTPRRASSIKGASASARTVPLAEMSPVDLVVTGCVAVEESGARLGKGGGFSDLEFALASAAGLIGPRTMIATTVHEKQVLPTGEIPMTDHDVPLDWIVTPERTIECRPGALRRPRGIRWQELTEEKIASIPLLTRLRRR